MIGNGRHVVVVDLGFGDAGKGATVDWLCSTPAGIAPVAVVRFNGGAQAAHNVITDDGRHHRFRQFGSGTLSGIPTYLSEHMMVDPIQLATEVRELRRSGVSKPLSLLTISARALLTTPIHAAVNRTREDLRGAGRHGSCGLGIGETAWYALANGSAAPRVGDSRGSLREKLHLMAQFYRPLLAGGHHHHPDVEDLVELYSDFRQAVSLGGPDELALLASRGRLIFEGAQGVLLDQWRGFHPYTTWSTTTPHNARSMLADIGEVPYVLGLTRSYQVRHGAGPFPSESAALTAALPEPHNGQGRYQGDFRAGHFDPVLLEYALKACEGVDALGISHLDRLGALNLSVDRYDTPTGPVTHLTPPTERDLQVQQRLTHRLQVATPALIPSPIDKDAFLDRVFDRLKLPIALTATGPRRGHRRELAGTPA